MNVSNYRPTHCEREAIEWTHLPLRWQVRGWCGPLTKFCDHLFTICVKLFTQIFAFFFLLTDVSGWMFLLVLADPDSPRQRAVKRLCVCVVIQLLWVNVTFMSGMVDPPRKRIVKMTMMSVVVTMICRVSCVSRFKCKLSANDTAPRRPCHTHTPAVKLKCAVLRDECRMGNWINQQSLWGVASATPDPHLPTQPQGITVPWPVPNYTSWYGNGMVW